MTTDTEHRTNTTDFESDYEIPASVKNISKTPTAKRKRRRDQQLNDETVDLDTDETMEISLSTKRKKTKA
jgi:hypothetical protein